MGLVLHPDSDVDTMLSALGLGRNSTATRAARRLFRTWDELEGFFLSFSSVNTLSKDGELLTAEGFPSAVDADCVLKSLEEFGAQQDGLTAAAFVCRARSEYTVHSRNKAARRDRDAYTSDLEVARTFVRTLTGVTSADIRLLYSHENRNHWTNPELSLWFHQCLQAGASAEYLGAIHQPWSGLGGWPPETVARLQAEGASAAYISRFWKHPARFAGLWASNVPFEYAVAMTPENEVE